MRWIRFLAGLGVWTGLAGAAPVTVAAASDLRLVLEEVVAAYRAQFPGHEVRVIYGSSGQFYAQICQGAPIDLYLSADTHYVRELLERGFGSRRDAFLYGRGQLALWAKGSKASTLGMQWLASPEIKRVAIANPRHAPYGQVAEASLKRAGLWDAVKPKLVFAENVAQAVQFVDSGAADAGIVALSLVLTPSLQGKGVYWTWPDTLAPPLEQAGLVLAKAQRRQAAERLRDLLVGEKGQRLLQRYGFLPVRESAWIGRR